MEQNTKMVMVAGMLVRADQVEGRLNALRFGRKLQATVMEDQMEEEKKMAEKGYSPTEIACLRHANRIRTMEAMGLGKSTRVKRISVPS